ncbi:EcsC family protein [Virgisporangium aliadipatigenens]|uniref:EcsC family protein n=1 Tax=Virgisporangium aliadipatigenens TaxID=741659 RepID=UPI0019414043|nr:EcsC family protein [Virgisporangium aliadipatigenens]
MTAAEPATESPAKAAKKAKPTTKKATPRKTPPPTTQPFDFTEPTAAEAAPSPTPADPQGHPQPDPLLPAAESAANETITVERSQILPAVPVVTGEIVHTEGSPAAPSLRDFALRPGHAVELLALTAVARYGEAARSNVTWLRDTYPNAAAEGIARVAAHRYVRQARNRGAVSGLAGPVAVLLDSGALNALHAELILHIAAAFGLDPTAPERAAEILYLQRVHDDLTDAKAAVHAATRTATGPGTELAAWLTGPDPVRLSKPLARVLGFGLLRVGARRLLGLVPGAGAFIGAIANARATDELAGRALRFYRTRDAAPGTPHQASRTGE